jgi:GNAT superfamily N-acetyltransferase
MLSLTVAGRAEFERIDRASREEIGGLLAELTESQQERVVSALNTARRLLSGGGDGPSWILRLPQAGDMGWVVQSHGSLYAREYGWDWTFESLVAEIVARFVRKYDPARERCWIAEREDERVGCVFLVRKTDEVGQLRCLLVDPSARGLGIGRRLVRECVRHARDVGYRRMMLWTAEVLDGARRIYEAEGFGLVASEPSRSFGHDVVFQSWERAL